MRAYGEAQKIWVSAEASVATTEVMSDERPLHTVYSQCVISFQNFLIQCTQDESLKSSEGLEKCYEEYSRLKIWGYQRRAAQGPSVPGSLAAVLVDYPDLGNIILEIYEQIIQSFDRRKYRHVFKIQSQG